MMDMISGFLPKEMLAQQAGNKIAEFMHGEITGMGIEMVPEKYAEFCTVIGLYEKDVNGKKELSPYYSIMHKGAFVRYAQIGEIIDTLHETIEKKIVAFMVNEAKNNGISDLSQLGVYIHLALVDHPENQEAWVAVPVFIVKNGGVDIRQADLKEIV